MHGIENPHNCLFDWGKKKKKKKKKKGKKKKDDDDYDTGLFT